MDALLLDAAVRELRAEALGLPLHRVVPQGPERLVLLLGDGWGREDGRGDRVRVHLGIEAGAARLHRTRLRAAPPSPPTPFQGLLLRELAGATLAGICRPDWERWAALEFRRAGTDRRLVVELFGARANLWWIDPDARVLGCARAASGRRGFAVGEVWTAPDPPGRPTPDGIDEARFRELAGPPEGMGRRLRGAVQGLGRTVTEALERQALRGEDPWPAFRGVVETVKAASFRPCLLEIPGGGVPIPSAVAVPPPEGGALREMGSAGEALDAWGEALDRVRRREAATDSLRAVLHGEIRRLERLHGRLEADLSREGEAEELVRQGNVLLAGLGQARVEGDRVTVPDPFDAEGRPVTLAIDPRLSLQENADRLFHRARKSRRGRRTVERRLAEVAARLPGLRDAAGRLEGLGTVEEVAALERALAKDGLLRVVRRPRTRKAAAARPRGPEVLPIRSYRSADGMEILVGRSGKDNDVLTFKVAAGQDFWLHAEGRAGAHVVVRNPDRLPRLPRATLEQAAQLAAFHSKARGGGKVEVMVTQRRHVKKGRGLPPGTVRVGRHEAVRVEPRMPFAEEV
ncbi:MAG: NFACT RNA binding domain-containing protein [Acidobacteriota bacterium]|jgi:predicted ribosome quality control (RQC) complex YloA/Tae2 family protein